MPRLLLPCRGPAEGGCRTAGALCENEGINDDQFLRRRRS